MKDYAKRDAELEAKATTTQEALAEHRWHWTLDESNPDRVSIRRYAKDVGRAESTIRRMVNGYKNWLTAADSGRTLNEHIEREKLGVEREAAVEAVAAATGVTFTAAKHKTKEVADVLSTARDRAERKGTSVEAEVVEVAEFRAKAKKADENYTKQRKARHSLRYIEVEGHLAAAKKKLADALNVSNDVAFTDEERELLKSTIDNFKSLLTLVDMRFGGGADDLDWDAELTKLTKDDT